jgi:phosphoribosyl 1,2-cyclic phosphodiesterase
MIRLTFLGTRADVEENTENHFYHSSLLLQSINAHPFRLLIDYGRIRAYDLSILKPDAILITHAHPDHYLWTLEETNSAVPVYLTRETHNYGTYAPVHSHILTPYESLTLGPFQIFPYRVFHSTNCPAVGFKIELPDGIVLAYNPDLVDIITKELILPGVDYYIGDGSTIKANLIRRKGGMFFGHTSIPDQISWCKEYGIENIIFTHIGKDTMERENYFQEQYPESILAYDQMKIMF